MQTLDNHLMRLFKQGKISLQVALQNSDSPNNLRLKFSLSKGRGAAAKQPERTGTNYSNGLSLQSISKKEAEDGNDSDLAA